MTGLVPVVRYGMSEMDPVGLRLYYEGKRTEFDPFEHRLANEHLMVEAMCLQHPDISYQLIYPEDLPPRDYRFTLRNHPSIVGIDTEGLPVFGDLHVLEIRLTPGYPVEPPVCYMASDTWHPNIQSDEGPFQGRICGNTEGFGAFYSLDELVLRIKAMLRYEVYHAGLDFPYPEDETVARWVREIGEPLDIVRPGRGVNPEWTPDETWRSRIRREKTMKIKLSV